MEPLESQKSSEAGQGWPRSPLVARVADVSILLVLLFFGLGIMGHVGAMFGLAAGYTLAGVLAGAGSIKRRVLRAWLGLVLFWAIFTLVPYLAEYDRSVLGFTRLLLVWIYCSTFAGIAALAGAGLAWLIRRQRNTPTCVS